MHFKFMIGEEPHKKIEFELKNIEEIYRFEDGIYARENEKWIKIELEQQIIYFKKNGIIFYSF